MREKHLNDSAIAAHNSQRQYIAQSNLIPELQARLAGRGLILDAGIGAGANALPLAQAGIPIVGVDISTAMFKNLQTYQPETIPLYLSYGDVTVLPFAKECLGGAIAAHIFHLIPAWQSAVAELCRVIVDKGLLWVNLGEASHLRKLILVQFQAALGGAFSPEGEAAGLQTAEDFHECLKANKAIQLEPIVIENPVKKSSDELISQLENNVFLWSSEIQPQQLKEAARQVREWAQDEKSIVEMAIAKGHFIKYYGYEIRHEKD